MSNATRDTRRGFLGKGIAAAGLCIAVRHEPALAAEATPAASSSGKAPGFRLALASYTLRLFPLDQALAMTQRVGLKHICLKSFHLPLEATAEEIAQARQKVAEAGLDLYGGGVISMANQADVDNAFRYAAAAGMRVIVASPRPPVLEYVNQKIEQTGIAVAIHNHGPGDKFFPTPESVYQQIKDFDPRFGLCIDVGHTARIGADPSQDARRFADRLLDVHIKDIDVASPQGRCIECGRGVLDLPGFLKTLVEIKYSGMLAFEYEKDEKDPLPGLAESVGYVRGVLDALLGIQDRSAQLG